MSRPDRKNKIILSSGVGGTGKTTFNLAYMYETDRPFIAFDPEYEIFTKRPDYKYFENAGDLWTFLINNELEVRQDNLKLILQSEDEAGRDKLLEHIFNDLQNPRRFPELQKALRCKESDLEFYIFLDEIDKFFNNFSNHIMKEIIRTGRNRQISTIATLKRPADISKMLVSQVHIYVWFRNFLDNDLKMLEAYCGKESAEIVRALPNYHYLEYNAITHQKQQRTLSADYLKYL